MSKERKIVLAEIMLTYAYEDSIREDRTSYFEVAERITISRDDITRMQKLSEATEMLNDTKNAAKRLSELIK